MADPDNRSAAAGKQVARVDTVKGESWVIVDKTDGCIGKIYFATDSSKLDPHDMELLQKIVDAYPQRLNSDPQKPISFMYNGYADYRYTTAHNDKLSQERAQAVADFVGDQARLGAYPNYAPEVRGMGVDYNVDLDYEQRPTDSASLLWYRRVDILAEGIKDPPPRQEEPEATPLLSRNWKARMYNSVSGGAGIVQGDVFWMQIVDLTNKLVMNFRYQGLGYGKSVGKVPKMGKLPPVSGGMSGSYSDWMSFDTYVKVDIRDFEGWTMHISAQAQLFAGGSADWVILMGPHDRRNAARISLLFTNFTKWDSTGIGVPGAGITGGTLQPSGDNDNRPRPWQAD